MQSIFTFTFTRNCSGKKKNYSLCEILIFYCCSLIRFHVFHGHLNIPRTTTTRYVKTDDRRRTLWRNKYSEPEWIYDCQIQNVGQRPHNRRYTRTARRARRQMSANGLKPNKHTRRCVVSLIAGPLPETSQTGDAAVQVAGKYAGRRSRSLLMVIWTFHSISERLPKMENPYDYIMYFETAF